MGQISDFFKSLSGSNVSPTFRLEMETLPNENTRPHVWVDSAGNPQKERRVAVSHIRQSPERLTVTCGGTVIEVPVPASQTQHIYDRTFRLMDLTAKKESAARWHNWGLLALSMIAGVILLKGISEGSKNTIYTDP